MIVCTGTLGRHPFPVKAQAAADAGFTGISIYHHEAESGLAPMLDALGLSVAEVDGVMAWMPGHPGVEVERGIDLAAELDARSITVVETTGVAPDPAKAAEGIDRVAGLASAIGLSVHVEPFPWSGIASLVDALAIIELVDQPNVGLMVDTWHLVRGPDAGRLPPEIIERVIALQVGDPAPTPGPSVRREAMTDRHLPGSVSIEIASRLPGIEPEVEVFGLDGSPDEMARAAFDALALLTEALAETD